jgi:hypothetical protein
LVRLDRPFCLADSLDMGRQLRIADLLGRGLGRQLYLIDLCLADLLHGIHGYPLRFADLLGGGEKGVMGLLRVPRSWVPDAKSSITIIKITNKGQRKLILTHPST